MTKQEQYAAALVKRGFKEIESPSRKYRAFRPPTASGMLYFLGKSGAVRSGRTVSTSFAIGDGARRTLLQEAAQ